MKECIECKVQPARYWDSSFCENCFRDLLKKGDQYKPVVTIVKIKNGTPTVIEVEGRKYQLQHENLRISLSGA